MNEGNLAVSMRWNHIYACFAHYGEKSSNPRTIASNSFRCAELAYYDGTEDRPIYIAADGFVFDVSSGRDFYGPGAGYHPFAGRFVWSIVYEEVH